jgi:hypothetical protein
VEISGQESQLLYENPTKDDLCSHAWLHIIAPQELAKLAKTDPSIQLCPETRQFTCHFTCHRTCHCGLEMACAVQP